MNLKLVYFSDFLLELSLYNREKMDFFVYLLMQIINEDKIDNEMSLEQILLDLSIPKEMLYLFNNAFYFLYDNNLINSKDENIEKIKKKEITLTSLGELCFKENYLPVYESSINKQVIFNPLDNKLEPLNNFNNDEDIIVINDLLNNDQIRELITNFKMSLFPDLDEEMIVEHKLIEANPFLVEVALIKQESGYYFKNKKHISLIKDLTNNLIYLEFKKDKFNDEDLVVLTSNIHFKFCIGSKTINSLNSDYYLIVDDEKAFELEGNTIYLPSEINTIIGDDLLVFNTSLNVLNYKEVPLEKELLLPLIKLNKKRGLGSDLKKWLEKNTSKFKQKGVIEDIKKLL